LGAASLVEDFAAVVVVGLILGAAGVVLEIILGRVAIHSIGSLLSARDPPQRVYSVPPAGGTAAVTDQPNAISGE
jgi:hypothetical protein